MKKILLILSALTLLLTAVGVSHGRAATTAPLSTPEIRAAVASGKKTVLFFQNPAGGPCGVQNGILQKLHKDRRRNFNIVNVSTMNPGDQKAFYDYGVRSLPSVMLVDSKGTLAHHFPPGIQSYESIAQALDKVK